MERNNFFNLGKTNMVLIAVSFLIIVIGFFVTAGVESGAAYNPDIFAARHVTVGPMISFAGFVFMIVAILYKKKEK